MTEHATVGDALFLLVAVVGGFAPVILLGWFLAIMGRNDQ